MGYFKAGFLPYYFIPELNLLDSLPDKLSEKALQKFQNLNANITQYIFQNNVNKTEIAEQWMNSIMLVLYRIEDFLETVKRYGLPIAVFTHSKIAFNSFSSNIREKLVSNPDPFWQ